MKPQSVGPKLLILLIIYGFLTLTIIALISCLVASMLVYMKSGKFIFNWNDDVIYSIRTGIAVGVPTGIGIWLLSKLKENKEKEDPFSDS